MSTYTNLQPNAKTGRRHGKMGRLPHRASVSLDPDTYADLRRLAGNEQIEMSKLIRRLLKEALARVAQ